MTEEVAHQFLYRYVGFELFDPQRAYLLPKTTYVAQSGRYVLLGFPEQAEADAMFEAAMKVTSEDASLSRSRSARSRD